MTYYHGYNSYNYNYCKPKPKPAKKDYEVTAFRESDLVDGNLSCGSKFTMPASATTCLTICDNDKKLSGDTCKNENANDKSGQQASIEVNGVEVGNGGQVYIEQYWRLKGSDGNWYVLVEIEQEGTHEDYFTFYTGNGYSMPPAGVELCVHSACDSSGLRYEDLGAGACEPVCDVEGSLPVGEVCYTIVDNNNPAGSSDEAYTLTITSEGCLQNVSFAEAYCLDIRLDDGTPSVDLCGTLSYLDDGSLEGASGVAAEDMDNVINYILNQDYGSDISDAEIQGAIWGLMDGIVFVADGAGTAADAQAVLDDALANGQNYEVAADGVHGVLIEPDDASYQRFVIGVECEDFIC